MSEDNLSQDAIRLPFSEEDFQDFRPGLGSQRVERQQGIYAIIHKASDRFYLGSSSHIYRRVARHRLELDHGKHHCIFLQRAWTKYGMPAFVFAILVEVASVEDLLSIEQQWLDQWAGPLLMNVNTRAECPPSPKGRRLSLATREKVRQANLGRIKGPHTAETKALLSLKNKGRIASPVQIEKSRLARLGIKRSEASKKKQSETLTGRKLSPEHAAKVAHVLRHIVRGPITEATREKLRISHLGKSTGPRSEETKEKIRRGHLGQK